VGGPDEYLFGEEKALLEVIEGRSPLPRLFAPHEQGLFAGASVSGWEGGSGPASDVSNPTLVNNCETLSNVPWILARGAAWFRSFGTAESPGTIVTTVVGDVVAPDVGEVELGVSLGDVIDAVGSGLAPGRSVKAVLSGVANPVILPSSLSAPVTYEGLPMGAAGFIVLDDTACMVQAALVCSRFLYVESCGQCPPCKRGSGEITRRLERLEAGVGTADDVDQIAHWLERVTDGNRCYLAVEERVVVTSILQAFGDEVAAHVADGRCPLAGRQLPMWTLKELRDGVATYDESFWRKRADWTYDDAPVSIR
jgi:NADH:ubiquinone oxidoreductase subunit F (NADH-binding)